ncbi:MAG: hypothetical protein JWP36_1773, partial [Paucimonas sp.]|nr:hypothetical protein [Paucimonas sp.]
LLTTFVRTMAADLEKTEAEQTLPLARFSADELTALCEGLSSCANHSRHPFPRNWMRHPDSPFNLLLHAISQRLQSIKFASAGIALFKSSASTSSFNDEAIEPVLHTQSLFSRALKAELARVSPPLRKNSASFLAFTCELANQAKADKLRPAFIGMLAVQVDAIIRSRLVGPAQHKDVQTIILWLTSNAAIGRLKDGGCVPLVNLCSLLRTARRQGILDAAQEKNDPVFLGLANLIRNIPVARFLERDARAAAAAASFLLDCMDSGQAQRWQDKPAYTQACDRVLAVIAASEMDTAKLSVTSAPKLFRFMLGLHAADEQAQQEAGPAQDKLSVEQRHDTLGAARALFSRLGDADGRYLLARVAEGRSIEQLLAAFTWLAQGGGVTTDELAQPLQALLDAIANTEGGDWIPASAARTARLLRALATQLGLSGTETRSALDLLDAFSHDSAPVESQTQTDIDADDADVPFESVVLRPDGEEPPGLPRAGDRGWTPVGGQLASRPAIVTRTETAAPGGATVRSNLYQVRPTDEASGWQAATHTAREKQAKDRWKPIEVFEAPAEENAAQTDATSAQAGKADDIKPDEKASSGRKNTKAKEKRRAAREAKKQAAARDAQALQEAQAARLAPADDNEARLLWFRFLKEGGNDADAFLLQQAKDRPWLTEERDPETHLNAWTFLIQQGQVELLEAMLDSQSAQHPNNIPEQIRGAVCLLNYGLKIEGRTREALALALQWLEGPNATKARLVLKLFLRVMPPHVSEFVKEAGYGSSLVDETANTDAVTDLTSLLEVSIRTNDKRMVQILLSHPDGQKLARIRTPHGANFVAIAAARADVEILQALLAIPGMPEIAALPDSNGITALMTAAVANRADNARCLLEYEPVRANAGAVTKWNETAFELALRDGAYKALMPLLDDARIRAWLVEKGDAAVEMAMLLKAPVQVCLAIALVQGLGQGMSLDEARDYSRTVLERILAQLDQEN